MKTIHHLQKMKAAGEKIAVLTAYDASFASILSEVGTDVILVGDSLGTVITGYPNTIEVTLEEIAYHIRCVVKGNKNAFIMADLPFMTYSNPDKAIDNASLLMRAGAQMVKLEGKSWLANTVQALTVRGIPVCAHLGLTAQYVHTLGGYKVQGRRNQEAESMLADALLLQQAGAAMIVIECVPEDLARHITEQLTIPTIGIGAGPDCDGQVLVLYDVLGISGYSHLTFTKSFISAENPGIEQAVKRYIDEVKQGIFPAKEHCFQ